MVEYVQDDEETESENVQTSDSDSDETVSDFEDVVHVISYSKKYPLLSMLANNPNDDELEIEQLNTNEELEEPFCQLFKNYYDEFKLDQIDENWSNISKSLTNGEIEIILENEKLLNNPLPNIVTYDDENEENEEENDEVVFEFHEVCKYSVIDSSDVEFTEDEYDDTEESIYF